LQQNRTSLRRPRAGKVGKTIDQISASERAGKRSEKSPAQRHMLLI